MRAVRCLALPLLALAVTSASGQDPEEFIGRLDVLSPPEEAGTYIAGVGPGHALVPPPEGVGPYPLVLPRALPDSVFNPEAEPDQGCWTYENAEEVEGKVALVRDGGCSLLPKFRHASEARAAGLVVYAAEPVGAADDSTLQDIWWPPDVIIFLHGLYATRYRGERLRVALEAGEEVMVVLRSEPPVMAEPEPGGGDVGLALAVWPNPARGSALITVSVGRPQQATVEVLDGLGRRVTLLYERTLGVGALPLRAALSSLPAGAYFVRVRGEGGTVTRPLLLAR